MKQKVIDFINKYDTLILVISTIVFEIIVFIFNDYVTTNTYKLLALIILYAIIVFIIFSSSAKRKNLFYIIYLLGVALRTVYILKTSIYQRQHDVGDFYGDGHLEYMRIIFTTKHLPLTNDWQFYHPPLWHFIGATWMHILNIFKVELNKMAESIQILSLTSSALIIIVVDKINIKLNLNNKYRYLIDSLFAFHPTLIILSGSINNDCFVFLLETIIILLLIKWDDNPNYKNTILLALTTGCCVMTKFNGAIMAVPILYVFIKKVINDIKKNKNFPLKYFKKIVTFALISLPIGLWFPIRSLIKFNTLQVPDPGEWIYVGDEPLIARFFKINIKELLNYANVSTDYNLPSFIIKSSIWGEYNFDYINLISKILIILNILVIIISILLIIKYILSKKKTTELNIILITWIITLVAMYIFNYKSPFACSMDFRYIAICLLPGITIIGYSLSNTKSKFLKAIIELTSILFILTSITFIIYI